MSFLNELFTATNTDKTQMLMFLPVSSNEETPYVISKELLKDKDVSKLSEDELIILHYRSINSKNIDRGYFNLMNSYNK